MYAFLYCQMNKLEYIWYNDTPVTVKKQQWHCQNICQQKALQTLSHMSIEQQTAYLVKQFNCPSFEEGEFQILLRRRRNIQQDVPCGLACGGSHACCQRLRPLLCKYHNCSLKQDVSCMLACGGSNACCQRLRPLLCKYHRPRRTMQAG